MRQVEQAYITSVFAKQAAPRSLVAGLLGAGVGGAGTYLASKGNWRKRLRNALIGAGVGAAGGVGLDYASRKLVDKAKPAVTRKAETRTLIDKAKSFVARKAESVVADRALKDQMSKARNGDPDARITVGPETPRTPADLDREAKELNASRDLSALLQQQKQPEVVGAHQRVLDRVAEADKKLRVIREAEAAERVAEGHARRRARFDAAAAKDKKTRRATLLSEAIELARTEERERLASLSPWRQRLHETLTGVPVTQADKNPFAAWRVLNSDSDAAEPPVSVIEDYLARNRKPADARQLARR